MLRCWNGRRGWKRRTVITDCSCPVFAADYVWNLVVEDVDGGRHFLSLNAEKLQSPLSHMQLFVENNVSWLWLKSVITWVNSGIVRYNVFWCVCQLTITNGRVLCSRLNTTVNALLNICTRTTSSACRRATAVNVVHEERQQPSSLDRSTLRVKRQSQWRLLLQLSFILSSMDTYSSIKHSLGLRRPFIPSTWLRRTAIHRFSTS